MESRHEIDNYLRANGYASAEDAVEALLQGTINVGDEPMVVLLRSCQPLKDIESAGAQVCKKGITKGWLLKQGEGPLSIWRSRFFVIENDGISYYLDESIGRGKQGEIKWNDIVHVAEAAEYSIDIEHASGRVYHLRASDAESYRAWLLTFGRFDKEKNENEEEKDESLQYGIEPLRAVTVKAIGALFAAKKASLSLQEVQGLNLDRLNEEVQVARSIAAAALSYVEVGSRRLKSIAPELWLDAMRREDFTAAIEAGTVAYSEGAKAELLEVATRYFQHVLHILLDDDDLNEDDIEETFVAATIARTKEQIVKRLDQYGQIFAEDDAILISALEVARSVVQEVLEPLLCKNESKLYHISPEEAQLYNIETRLGTSALICELARLNISSPRLDSIAGSISSEYVSAAEQQVQSWIRGVRTKHNEYEIRNSAHGKLLITAAPEDAIRSSRELVRLASVFADPQTHARCCRVVVEALALFAEEAEDVDKDQAFARQLEACLARANDCARLGSYALELVGASNSRDSVATSVRSLLNRAQADDIKALSETTEETCAMLAEASDAAAQRATHCVEDDLLLAMSGLFSQDWEAGDAVLHTVKATLYDYLNDFNQQLDPRCFPSLLRSVFDTVVAAYIERLCSPTGPAAQAASSQRPRELRAYLAIQRDIMILDDIFRDFFYRPSEVDFRQQEGDQEDDALLPLRSVYTLIVELLNDQAEFPHRVVELLHEPFGRFANDIAKGVLALDPSLKREKYESIKKECLKHPPPDLPGIIQLHDIFSKKKAHTRHSETYTSKFTSRFRHQHRQAANDTHLSTSDASTTAIEGASI